jgi:hypothetical protein
MDEGFTYEQNPAEALRIMLRMSGYRDDEIDEQLLAEAREHYESFPVESLEWPEKIPG